MFPGGSMNAEIERSRLAVPFFLLTLRRHTGTALVEESDNGREENGVAGISGSLAEIGILEVEEESFVETADGKESFFADAESPSAHSFNGVLSCWGDFFPGRVIAQEEPE